ncbi:Uncharacterized membrane protein [Caloramator quimbayensis]|uniref:Uncharacterized membrane protein n=1 Tax=Caloramator quimbayensis TaxID=1147123 RepID=A0A1T4XWL1_9CLOT|nr:DUF979 domain-containing protein [Caloramator quimbayensis]SKA93952.1 Uncharacterized membrane protein [Caloramator quimbayensis]
MLKNSLTELLYVLCGLVCFYSVFVTLKDKSHPAKYTTALFWGILGFTFTFSRIGLLWGNEKIMINDTFIGYLILVMALLSAFKLVKFNKFNESTNEFKEKMAQSIGNKIFIPALSLAIVAFLVAQFWTKQLGSLVALGISTVIALILAIIITKGKGCEVAEDGRRLLELVGPLSILPQLLAALGSVFAAAGVGNVIANGIKTVIPQGNILLGVIAYCIGMALFTMIMGNAFAAFAVITAGIGVPFVFSQGANPVIASALALTAGYCGTLMTPMAANFNIVPTAILEIDDKKYGLIKYQLPIALIMLLIHIILMYVWAF